MTRSNLSTFLSFLPLLFVSLAPSLIRGAAVTLYEVYPTDIPTEPIPTDAPAFTAIITAAGVGSDGSTTYLIMEGSAGSDASSTDPDAFTVTLVEGSQGLNDGSQSCSFDGTGNAACVVDLGSFVTSTGDGGAPISTELFTTYTGALTPVATLVNGGAVLTQAPGGASSGGSSSSATPPASGGASAATPSTSAGGTSQGGGGASTPEGGSNSTSSVAPQTSGGGGNSTSNTTNAAARGLNTKGHYGWLIGSSLIGIVSGIWLV